MSAGSRGLSRLGQPITITLCRLTLHENLFFATREVGRLYETGRYLHNYALTYALELVQAPYRQVSAVPRYAEDLTLLNASHLYVTPALPIEVAFAVNTFKYADNRYRVKMEPGSRNTPSFGRAKELAVGSQFKFAIFSDASAPAPNIPRWLRLGKWMSKAYVEVVEQAQVEQVRNGEFTHSLPLNPLDLPTSSRALAYDIISMPPVSLLDNALVYGDYYQLANGRALAAGLTYRFPEQ